MYFFIARLSTQDLLLHSEDINVKSITETVAAWLVYHANKPSILTVFRVSAKFWTLFLD